MITNNDNNEDIILILEKEYGIHIKSLNKIKNAYKLFDGEKLYCFKPIKYEYGHFIFILKAIEHLKNNGFEGVPDIIHTCSGNDYVKFNNSYCYMTEWINSRHSNYDNPVDLKSAAKILAYLHKKSFGFEVTYNMKPRIGWLKWPNIFETRKNEILNFKKIISQKENKTRFDNLYMNMMEEEINRCQAVLAHLSESDYIMKMKNEILNRSFCHHDYANHNVLIDNENKINIIDFDYCILDSHLHDLSSLLIRKMKHGKWDIESAEVILESYDSVYGILQNDIPIMAAFIEFPQEYWQVGIQYYWEKQPWSEETFIDKLENIENDRALRQEFVETFRTYRFQEGMQGGNYD